MIYQLVKHLKNTFPTETIYAESRILTSGQSVIPDRCVLVRDTGGSEQPWTLFQKPATVQILCRDSSAPGARTLAYNIFEELTSRFGLVLPSVTVNGVVYAAITTAQISAIQTPYNLGPDEDGRIEYVSNYEIFYTRS